MAHIGIYGWNMEPTTSSASFRVEIQDCLTVEIVWASQTHLTRGCYSLTMENQVENYMETGIIPVVDRIWGIWGSTYNIPKLSHTWRPMGLSNYL